MTAEHFENVRFRWKVLKGSSMLPWTHGQRLMEKNYSVSNTRQTGEELIHMKDATIAAFTMFHNTFGPWTATSPDVCQADIRRLGEIKQNLVDGIIPISKLMQIIGSCVDNSDGHYICLLTSH
jgi:hypothetical protein